MNHCPKANLKYPGGQLFYPGFDKATLAIHFHEKKVYDLLYHHLILACLIEKYIYQANYITVYFLSVRF